MLVPPAHNIIFQIVLVRSSYFFYVMGSMGIAHVKLELIALPDIVFLHSMKKSSTKVDQRVDISPTSCKNHHSTLEIDTFYNASPDKKHRTRL